MALSYLFATHTHTHCAHNVTVTSTTTITQSHTTPTITITQSHTTHPHVSLPRKCLPALTSHKHGTQPCRVNQDVPHLVSSLTQSQCLRSTRVLFAPSLSDGLVGRSACVGTQNHIHNWYRSPRACHHSDSHPSTRSRAIGMATATATALFVGWGGLCVCGSDDTPIG